MNNVFTYYLYGITIILLGISFIKSKRKTILSFKKAWKMFVNVLPQFLGILLFVGLVLAVMKPEIIQKAIGAQSGFKGMIFSACIGAAAFVPVLIAFPIASQLLSNGAGIMQIAVFISTLTTVGFVTLPLEMKYLGRKAALMRNIFAFLFSFGVAFIINEVL
jgi:uncharacterized membrane protein YraQ (UPF0718 family)